MVVLPIVGGLGNQLWIYFFGKALELRGNEVAYDLSYFDRDESRAYVLDRYAIPVRLARPGGTEYNEGDLSYHPELLRKYEDCTLRGYFQCPKYLEGVDTKLPLRNQPSDKTLAVAKKIKESNNSTFLHVRRSDNLSRRGLDFHNVSPIAYYEKAIEFISERVGKLNLFIFSDDIEWCKNCLPFPATFVDHNNPGVDWDAEYSLKRNNRGGEHEDLMLMAGCQHGITATSSYSWWAGWLIQNPDKIVISPDQWFVGETNQYSRDMIPSTWFRL